MPLRVKLADQMTPPTYRLEPYKGRINRAFQRYLCPSSVVCFLVQARKVG